jgi:hypothetical protein
MNDNVGYRVIKAIKYPEGKEQIRLHVVGIDFGSPLLIIEESKKSILVYQAGHTAWAGVGRTLYHSPAFLVFEKESGTTLKTWNAPRFEYGRGGRKEAYKKANLLRRKYESEESEAHTKKNLR